MNIQYTCRYVFNNSYTDRFSIKDKAKKNGPKDQFFAFLLYSAYMNALQFLNNKTNNTLHIFDKLMIIKRF